MKVFSKRVVVFVMWLGSTACSAATEEVLEPGELSVALLCDRTPSDGLLRVRFAETDAMRVGSLAAHGAVLPTAESPVCYQPATFLKAIDCSDGRSIDLVSVGPFASGEEALTCQGRIDGEPLSQVPPADYSRECAETTAVCESISGIAVGVLDAGSFVIESWEPAP